MQRAQHEHRKDGKAASASAKARSCPVMLAAGAWEEEYWGKGSLELIVEGPECHTQVQGEFCKQKGQSLIKHFCIVLHKL